MAATRSARLCMWVLEKLAGSFVTWLMTIVAGPALVTFWGSIKSNGGIQTYGLILLLASLVVVWPFWVLLRFMVYNRRCLRNPRDIANAIDHWFTEIAGCAPILAHAPRFFVDFEKGLKLKHGTSRRYLPMLALRHRHVAEICGKTFRLSDLARENDPKPVLLEHLKKSAAEVPPERREVVIACDKIDRELRWPKGATKTGLLYCQPPWNPEFTVEDAGRGKVRIVPKAG